MKGVMATRLGEEAIKIAQAELINNKRKIHLPEPLLLDRDLEKYYKSIKKTFF